MIAFINEFLSYILVFVIFVSVMITAGVIGVNIRKKQDAKVSSEGSVEDK